VVRDRRAYAAAIALALVLLGLILFYPTDRRKVKKVFSRTAEWVSKEGPEGALSQAQRIPEGERLFADPCELEAEAYRLSQSFTPRELARMAVGARSRFDTLELKFYDLEVWFPEDGKAEATVTLRLEGRSSGGESLSETHEMDCELVEEDGRWLFRSIKLVEVLKK
jgi:hypothetical protein